MTNLPIFCLLLLGTFWVGQFIWFPDGAKFLELLTRDAAPPSKPIEHWAMQLYRETFSPDCGAHWVRNLMVYLSWASWALLCTLALQVTLFAAELLPKTPGTAWVALSNLLLCEIIMMLLPILLMIETLLLHRKGISLRPHSRKAQWMRTHPAPGRLSSSGKLPWWFWLDSSVLETLVRVAVFLGGFLASVAALFFFSHVSAPKMITAGTFWAVLFFWFLAITWLAVSLTIWLSQLDWTHRRREVLILWASKQR